MTPIEVFEALYGKSFGYIEDKEGSKYGGIQLEVKFCTDEGDEPACIEVTPDGLALHFHSDDGSGSNKRGRTVWFADIIAVR